MVTMATQNANIRQEIRQAGILQWQLADIVGVSEATLVRWFRHELTEEQKKRILDALDEWNGGGA